VIEDRGIDDLFNRARALLPKSADIIDYSCSYPKNMIVNLQKCSTFKDEIRFLLEETASLLEKGVASDNIRIHQLPKAYVPYAKEVFGLAGIDLRFTESENLWEFEAIKKIVSELRIKSDADLRTASQTILLENQGADPRLLTDLTDLLNGYLGSDFRVSDILDDLVYQLKNTPASLPEQTNVLVCENLLRANITEADHVFIVGCHQDHFPSVYLDDDYLTDSEKDAWGLVNSRTKNQKERQSCLQLLERAGEVSVTYNLESIIPVSSFLFNLPCGMKVKEIPYSARAEESFSEALDLLQLGKKFDLFHKYGQTDHELSILAQNYPDNGYRKFSHAFQGLDAESWKKYQRKPLVLSYTTIDKYYQCGFLFYLEQVLKVKRPTNEEVIFLGNLIHGILCDLFKEENVLDVDGFVSAKMEAFYVEKGLLVSKRDRFFMEKYQTALKPFYEFLEKQKGNSAFPLAGLEKEYCVELKKDPQVILKGKIDKILTGEVGGKTYAAVIDYKTSRAEINFDRIFYGLNMQLMIYFYLLDQAKELPSGFGGGYLQKVMPPGILNRIDGQTYQEQLQDFFRLVGYSSSDHNVLKAFDPNYETKNRLIQNIKINKDGSFSAGSRVLDQTKYKKLLALVEEKINEAVKAILSGHFPINPKKLGNFDSCQFCSYRDLCGRDELDYQELTEMKNLEFLGGENDSE
jgi:ATP-dependent helicase/DNAse subunit B